MHFIYSLVLSSFSEKIIVWSGGSTSFYTPHTVAISAKRCLFTELSQAAADFRRETRQIHSLHTSTLSSQESALFEEYILSLLYGKLILPPTETIW